MYDVYNIKKDFPILNHQINNKHIVYLDSAASSQKPQCVIDKIVDIYQNTYANVHRGIYDLSEEITLEYENARKKILKFLNASPEKYTAVYTRGTTESLNIIAQSWGQENLKQGDEILLSEMEHHANIVPWQITAQKTGAKIQVAKILKDGSLDMEDFQSKLSEKTKIVSIAHASNVLGTINDVQTICKLAKKVGAKVSIDSAQSSPHMLDDLSKIDCDFLSMSGHKCFAPTGIGALVAKTDILNAMPPYQSGGDMIESVSWQGTTFRPAPERFEAGTPHIAGAIGFATALEYLMSIDIESAKNHEHMLLQRLTERLAEIPQVEIFGTSKNKVAVASFTSSERTIILSLSKREKMS